MELKLSGKQDYKDQIESSNRTFMELKLNNDYFKALANSSSNRTFMELKFFILLLYLHR